MKFNTLREVQEALKSGTYWRLIEVGTSAPHEKIVKIQPGNWWRGSWLCGCEKIYLTGARGGRVEFSALVDVTYEFISLDQNQFEVLWRLYAREESK